MGDHAAGQLDERRHVDLLAGRGEACRQQIQQGMFGRHEARRIAALAILLVKVREGVLACLVDHQHREEQLGAQIPLVERRALSDQIDDFLLDAGRVAVVIQPPFLVFALSQHHVLIASGVNIVPHLTGGEIFVAHKVPLIAVRDLMQATPVAVFRRQPEAADRVAGFRRPAPAVIRGAGAVFIGLHKVAVANITIGFVFGLERNARQRIVEGENAVIVGDQPVDVFRFAQRLQRRFTDFRHQQYRVFRIDQRKLGVPIVPAGEKCGFVFATAINRQRFRRVRILELQRRFALPVRRIDKRHRNGIDLGLDPARADAEFSLRFAVVIQQAQRELAGKRRVGLPHSQHLPGGENDAQVLTIVIDALAHACRIQPDRPGQRVK
ncbi:Uncharacterised protein [Serratia marcescens]|nr:Uncharacterised protein [Serratia marcescens]